jgi:hypothetical protein
MKSQEIVTLFLQRKNEFGVVGLTKKQCSWLVGQLSYEGELRSRHYTVWDNNDVAYHFNVYPQGGGFITPPTVPAAYVVPENELQRMQELADKLRGEGNEPGALMIEDTMRLIMRKQ